MLVIGSVMTLVGLSLLWVTPYTGALFILIGLGIAWSAEDQKIKKKNERKLYDEENEREFNRLKFDDPISPKLLELSTLLYGTIKHHEAWLSERLDALEESYSNNTLEAIRQTQDITSGEFKNLFVTALKYQSVCMFLNRDMSKEIFEDIESIFIEAQTKEINDSGPEDQISSLDEILADYDLEEWAKKALASQVSAGHDRNTVIRNVTLEARKELNKTISVSCLHDEWIINGRIKFMI